MANDFGFAERLLDGAQRMFFGEKIHEQLWVSGFHDHTEISSINPFEYVRIRSGIKLQGKRLHPIRRHLWASQ